MRLGAPGLLNVTLKVPGDLSRRDSPGMNDHGRVDRRAVRTRSALISSPIRPDDANRSWLSGLASELVGS